MPFRIPTPRRLIRNAQMDIESELGNGQAFIRHTFEKATAQAIGGAAYQLHLHLRWITRQIFVNTADEDFVLLHAAYHLGENARKPATAARFTITVTGSSNETIPSGAQWQRSDGETFSSQQAYALGPSPFSTSVEVVADVAGVSGNTTPGDTLSLVSPIANVDNDASVEGDANDGDVGGGADLETIQELAQRTLDRIQSSATSGGPGDYVVWAKEVAGVTRAWQFANYYGPGTVGVFFVRDNDTSIIPSASEIADVQAHLDARAPVTAVVTALAPTLVPFAPVIQIEPYGDPDVEAAVHDQLSDFIKRNAEPGATLYLSQIGEAISLASGEVRHVVTSPTTSVTHAATEIPVYNDGAVFVSF